MIRVKFLVNIDICPQENNTFRFKIQQFVVEQMCIGENVIPHVWKIKAISQTESVSFEEIHSKMVKLDLLRETFLCEISNIFESQ